MKFVVDGLATGRMVRILSVVDAYTCDCPVLEADFSPRSGRVIRLLEGVSAERGRPESLRSHNGPDFTSRLMIGSAEGWKVALVNIQHCKPMQNGHVQLFHDRLRDECLNVSCFRPLHDVRCTLATWRREYNSERPHTSLYYRTPDEFRQKTGYADVESNMCLPHLHSLDDDGENRIPMQNQNRETPIVTGCEKG